MEQHGDSLIRIENKTKSLKTQTITATQPRSTSKWLLATINIVNHPTVKLPLIDFFLVWGTTDITAFMISVLPLIPTQPAITKWITQMMVKSKEWYSDYGGHLLPITSIKPNMRNKEKLFFLSLKGYILIKEGKEFLLIVQFLPSFFPAYKFSLFLFFE